MFKEIGQQLLGFRSRRKQPKYHYQKLAAVKETRKEEATVSVSQKLMLGALLWGVEAANNFLQLNMLSVLQLLGMPLSMSSLVGIVSGPLSVLLLAWLGWLTDRGANPQRRKTAVTILVSATLMVGVSCVLTANAIHLNHLHLDAHANAIHLNHLHLDVHANASSAPAVMELGSSSGWGNDTGGSNMVGDFGQAREKNGSHDLQTFEDVNRTGNRVEDEAFFTVPFKAILAMMGFMLVDIGFDGTSSFAKAYIVTCSPVPERASSLVVSVIVASGGGLFMSLLGMADMTSLPGLPVVKGGGASVKVGVEAVLVVVSILVGLPITLLTGQALRSQTDRSTTLEDNDHYDVTVSSPQESLPYPATVEDMETESHRVDLSERVCNGNLTDSKRTLRINGAAPTLEESCDIENPFDDRRNTHVEEITENNEDFVNKIARTSVHTDLAIITSEKVDNSSSSSENECALEENLSLLNQRSFRKDIVDKEAETDFNKDTESYGKISQYNDRNDTHTIRLYDTENSESETESESSESLKALVEKEPQSVTEKAQVKQTCCQRGVKVRIAFIMIATGFTVGMAFLFSMGISDYVAKAIYLGDPDAEAGTDSHLRYGEGLEVASKGFCIHYSSYLLFNLVNPQLLKYLGYRLEFLLVQVVTAGSMVVLALTARLEVFFLLAAVSGIHRVTFHVLPFATATHILKTADPESQQVGFVISLIALSIPLGDCLLFTWMGPLQQLTGVVSVPLWMGAAYGCLSALAFFFVGNVE